MIIKRNSTHNGAAEGEEEDFCLIPSDYSEDASSPVEYPGLIYPVLSTIDDHHTLSEDDYPSLSRALSQPEDCQRPQDEPFPKSHHNQASPRPTSRKYFIAAIMALLVAVALISSGALMTALKVERCPLCHQQVPRNKINQSSHRAVPVVLARDAPPLLVRTIICLFKGSLTPKDDEESTNAH